MPELEVVQDVLRRRAVGQTICEVIVIPPDGVIVMRDLTTRDSKPRLLDNAFKRTHHELLPHLPARWVYQKLSIRVKKYEFE